MINPKSLIFFIMLSRFNRSTFELNNWSLMLAKGVN